MTWLTPIILLPLLFLLGAMGYLLLRNGVRVWVDHRVKQQILEKFEHDPDLLDSFDDLNGYLDGWEKETQVPPLFDPLLIGLIMAALGMSGCLLAWTYGYGKVATSAFIGGVLTVVFGFVLTLVGIAIRYLLRPPSEEMLRERLREHIRRLKGEEEESSL